MKHVISARWFSISIRAHLYAFCLVLFGDDMNILFIHQVRILLAQEVVI